MEDAVAHIETLTEVSTVANASFRA